MLVQVQHWYATGAYCLNFAFLIDKKETNIRTHEFFVNFENCHELPPNLFIFLFTASSLSLSRLLLFLDQLELDKHRENVAWFVEGEDEAFLVGNVFGTPRDGISKNFRMVPRINCWHQKFHALTYDFVGFVTENTIRSLAPLSYRSYFVCISWDHNAWGITLIKA